MVNNFPRLEKGDPAIPLQQCIVATFVASGTIAKGDVVILTATNQTTGLGQVATTATAASVAVIGFALDADSGGFVSVMLDGVILARQTAVAIAVGKSVGTSTTAGSIAQIAALDVAAAGPADIPSKFEATVGYAMQTSAATVDELLVRVTK